MDKEVIDKFFELLKKANEENNEKAIVDLMKLIGLEGNINELEEDGKNENKTIFYINYVNLIQELNNI